MGYSEITSQPYANHCAVGTYRHEDRNVLLNFIGGFDCMETGRLAFDFRAQNAGPQLNDGRNSSWTR